MNCSSRNQSPGLRFLLATRNKGKILEIRSVLQAPHTEFQSLLDFPNLPGLNESGVTFAENARLKAGHCYGLAGTPALADDSGLTVDALGGAPGVYSARFASTDEERIARLLALLKEVEAQRRTARFVCAICLWQADSVIEVEGEVEGEIVFEPRGTGGFGYDPIFYYPPLGRTFAELTLEEKNRVSHRARALERLQEKLAHPRFFSR